MVMYPQCLGLCGQGRYDCEMPEQCTGALLLRYRNECRAQLAAEPELMGARMGMATYATEPGDLAPVRMWPWAEHSRPGKLTERDLDAHIAAKSTAPRIPRSRAMPSLMAAAPRSHPSRLRLALRRGWRAVVRFFLAPRVTL